jgi:hypothetical protein
LLRPKSKILKSDRFERRDPSNPLIHMGLDDEIRQNWPLSCLEAAVPEMTSQAIFPATRYRRVRRAKVVMHQNMAKP